ncbi:hypothetical protein ACOME3_006599 [Neoechinorhynchus agilis]
MGIPGLLVFARDNTRQVHITEFANCTAAIDVYSWIYKGAFNTAMEIMLEGKTQYLKTYINRRINVLTEAGIRPLMVFDGHDLPLKSDVDAARRQSRQASLRKAHDLLERRGKTDLEVRSCFRSAFEVTFEIAREVMSWLRDRNIDYLVAPYEADAQLAFLNISGIVDLVISEDSDLIPFGCRKILYKLDENGHGCLIDDEKFPALSKLGHMYSMDRLRWMCIMAGCDYFKGIPGIGLAKARKILMQIRHVELKEVLRCVKIRLSTSTCFDEDFDTKFELADLMFKHQDLPSDFKMIVEFGEIFGGEITVDQCKGHLNYSQKEIECVKKKGKDADEETSLDKSIQEESLIANECSNREDTPSKRFLDRKKPQDTMSSPASPYFGILPAQLRRNPIENLKEENSGSK